MKRLLLSVVFLFLIPLVQGQERIEVTLGPATDSWWTSSVYDYGSGGMVRNDYLQVGGWCDFYTLGLKIELSDLPRVARSAKIRLFCFSRREFAGDVGLPTPMRLSYLMTPWGLGGGLSNPAGYQTVPGELPAPVAGQWYDIEITSLFNKWQSGEVENNGFFLSPTLTGVAGSHPNFNVFRSPRFADEAYRPRLVVVSAETEVTYRVAVASTARPPSSGRSSSVWSFDFPRLDLTQVRSAFILFSPIAALALIAAAVIAVSHSRSTRMGHW